MATLTHFPRLSCVIRHEPTTLIQEHNVRYPFGYFLLTHPMKVTWTVSLGKKMVTIFFSICVHVAIITPETQCIVTTHWYMTIFLFKVTEKVRNMWPRTLLLLTHAQQTPLSHSHRALQYSYYSGDYSPDLAWCDFICFQQWRIALNITDFLGLKVP
jgi:hypothetical protein